MLIVGFGRIEGRTVGFEELKDEVRTSLIRERGSERVESYLPWR